MEPLNWVFDFYTSCEMWTKEEKEKYEKSLDKMSCYYDELLDRMAEDGKLRCQEDYSYDYVI